MSQTVFSQEEIVDYPRPKLWQPPDTSILDNKLIGTWYLKGGTNDTLIFLNGTLFTEEGRLMADTYISMKPYQEFKEGYTAWCGNDDRIRHNSGKYSFDSKTMTLETTIPIDFKGKKHKVIYLSMTKLVLVRKQ